MLLPQANQIYSPHYGNQTAGTKRRAAALSACARQLNTELVDE
jgi:hypothetical protein